MVRKGLGVNSCGPPACGGGRCRRGNTVGGVLRQERTQCPRPVEVGKKGSSPPLDPRRPPPPPPTPSQPFRSPCLPRKTARAGPAPPPLSAAPPHPPSHGLHGAPLRRDFGQGDGQGQALHHLGQVGQHHRGLDGRVHQLVHGHFLQQAQRVVLVREQALQVALPVVRGGARPHQPVQRQQHRAAPADGALPHNPLGDQVGERGQRGCGEGLRRCKGRGARVGAVRPRGGATDSRTSRPRARHARLLFLTNTRQQGPYGACPAIPGRPRPLLLPPLTPPPPSSFGTRGPEYEISLGPQGLARPGGHTPPPQICPHCSACGSCRQA